MLDLKIKYPPSVAVIEQGFYRFHLATQQLYKVQGIANLAYYDIPIVYFSPISVKKAVTGNGRASKDEVAEAVLKKYSGVTVLDNDQSDAIAIGATYFQNIKKEKITQCKLFKD